MSKMKRIVLIVIILMAFTMISAVSAENSTQEIINPIEDVDISFGESYGKVLTNEQRYDVYVYNVPDECEITEFNLYIDNESVDYHGQDVDKNTEFRHFEGYYNYNFTSKNYKLSLEFIGNKYYQPYTKIINFEATSANIYIPSVVTQPIYFDRNVEAFFANGNQHGDFVIYADGKKYFSKTINGENKFIYPLDGLSFGKHDIEVVYNDIHQKKTIEVTYILDLNLCENVLIATIPSDATRDLEIIIDGVKYKYDYEGIVITKAGLHNITARYPGDSKYPSKIVNVTYEVPEVPTIIAPKSISMFYKDLKTASFKVTGISQLKITLKSSTRTIKPINGVVKYKIPTLTAGKYKITLWDGELCWKTTTLTVKHLITLKSVSVKKSAKRVTLQATLKNVKVLKNKQVIFKFNGKTFKAKTNSKGIAKVTIKSSVLKKLKAGKKITYQATYIKDTVKKTVKVKR